MITASRVRRLSPVRGRGTTLALLLAALLAFPGVASADRHQAGPGGPTVPPTSVVPTADEPGDTTRRVTLITGDVVAWQRTASGRQSAWLVDPADSSHDLPLVYEQDGEVHLVPHAAQAYVDSGVLDAHLFNITLLVREGLDDRSRDDWSLLVQGEGPAARRAVPAVPPRAIRERALPSVGIVAVSVAKDDTASMWSSLRGNRAVVPGNRARLASGATLWLNAPVHATLDDSVRQVRAPAAWAAGFDGTGSQVAVLDTGYDPDHPDIQGRVTDARDFTGTDGETPARDEHGHGTHVAATVGGSGEGADGLRPGVAPGADLVIGKVLDASGSGTSDQIIAGMEWAARGGADVINMSLGTAFPSDGSDPLSQAVDRLSRETGALFVVAAGNTGPAEGSVTAPGAAELALTVGAVDKRDRAAAFSARGLRPGSAFRMKPEIVAPGVDIVAARAHGTSLGNLVDAQYTSMSGTSMATPHVAGAAAVVAQAHPGWDATRLKARLVSTADPLTDEPVGVQGAGRLDVRGGATDPVAVDAGVLSLGALDHDADRVTRRLTYANTTGRPLDLRLSSDVHGTGSDTALRPDLTLSRRTLTVPARGTASVTVRVDPRDSRPGSYAGRVVAEVDGRGNRPVASLVSLRVTAPPHTLRIQARDRQGGLATGHVDVWSAEDGTWMRLWLQDGAASTEVPEGSYTVMATVEAEDTGPWPTDQTVGGDPDVRLTRDTVLRFDARDATPLRVQTPRASDQDSYNVFWQRRVQHRSFKIKIAQGDAGTRLYTLPTPKARTGDFHVGTQWRQVEPIFSASVTGAGEQLTPTPTLASNRIRYVGEQTLQVVDVGSGLPDDYAGKDVAGAVALAARSDEASLHQQSQAAAHAGATLLMVTDDQPGAWTEGAGEQGVPTYRVDRAAGNQLRELLQGKPDTRLQVSGKADAEYLYELAFVEDRIPRRLSYRVRDQQLAVVRSDYRENSGRTSRRESWVPELGPVGIGQASNVQRTGPVVRTEYVTTTPGVRWQRYAAPHGEFPSFYWTWSRLVQYRPAQETRQLWWGPVVGPGVLPGVGNPKLGAPVARYRDAIRVLMPHYNYGFAYGHIDNRFGDTSRLTLRSRGKELGSAPWPAAQFTVPAAAAAYQLRLEVAHGSGNMFDTSVRTDTTWTFRSGRPTAERAVLPLLQVRYDLPGADSHNRVPAGTPTRLILKPQYQPGANGPGDLQVGVRVSYDNGARWSTARVQRHGAGFAATLPAGTAGYGDVEVTVSDSDGTSMTQRIDHAWKVGRDQ